MVVFSFDIWSLISISIAFISIIITIIANASSQKRDAYFTIDSQYKDLLNIGLKNPKLRNPLITCNYKKLYNEDQDLYFQYESYAYMIWNFLETIFDFASTSKSGLEKTWAPVLFEENKLHYRWFLDNKYLFKKQFQDYVINHLNALDVSEGNMNDFKYIYKAMQKEFPLEELKDKNQMLHLLVTGKYKMLVFRFKHRISGDNSMVGYAIVYSNTENSMMFLDYLNIIPRYQSCGYGSETLKLLLSQLDEEKKKGILFEIEPADDGIKGLKGKRRKFYLRNGASQLDVNYYLPTFNNDCIPLDLMILPAENINFIDKNEIKVFIKEAISAIHSDYTHTEQVINKYYDDIPDYSRQDKKIAYLSKGSKKDLSYIFEMLELNFSDDFKMNIEKLEALMDTNQYVLYLLKNYEGEIVGYSFIFESKENDFIFMDYLCISKFYQNHGYGVLFVELLLKRYENLNCGIICETPYATQGHFDYYAKFTNKSKGHYLDVKYFFPSEEKIPMRLTVILKDGVNFASKESIAFIVKEANMFIHSDIKDIEKIALSNIKNIKDFTK